MKDLQYRSVNEEENNVVLYNKASGETSVLDYNEDTSLMYIYGPRISTHFNFLPLNYSYISISDGDKYLNNLDDKGNRHVWNSKLVPLIEQENAFNMLNNIVANRTLSFKEIGYLSGGYLKLYMNILECISAMKNGSNIFWQLPEAHLHPSAQCELPNLFLDILSKGKATKPFVITSNSEHIVLRTMKLIREGKLKHNKVSIMHMDIK